MVAQRSAVGETVLDRRQRRSVGTSPELPIDWCMMVDTGVG
jgi:hypothetical protein